jgi:colanic acid/amylovoran biosynthesis glycosyltransferase
MGFAYITAQMPWGEGEAFLMQEALEMKRQAGDFLIIPRSPAIQVFHQEARPLLGNSLGQPLININIAALFAASLVDPFVRNVLGDVISRSRSPAIIAKNLAVFPKAVFTARAIKKNRISHIHCHWGATTATMAYAAARITGLPWSFTLHRWDIQENNMLEEKARTAEFIRCISEHGKQELITIIGEKYESKIKVIHMGADVSPLTFDKGSRNRIFTIAVPANLIEVKGHKYLIEAIGSMAAGGAKDFQCVFYGDGHLRGKLINNINERGLNGFINMPGAIPHEELIELYKNREIDCVVLPSINTSSGEHEGIPVALMEAMALGIPVVSTDTGAIPELLYGGAGMLVKEKSSADLAAAIQTLMGENSVAEEMALAARRRMESDFDIKKNVREMLRLIGQ